MKTIKKPSLLKFLALTMLCCVAPLTNCFASGHLTIYNNLSANGQPDTLHIVYHKIDGDLTKTNCGDNQKGETDCLILKPHNAYFLLDDKEIDGIKTADMLIAICPQSTYPTTCDLRTAPVVIDFKRRDIEKEPDGGDWHADVLRDKEGLVITKNASPNDTKQDYFTLTVSKTSPAPGQTALFIANHNGNVKAATYRDAAQANSNELDESSDMNNQSAHSLLAVRNDNDQQFLFVGTGSSSEGYLLRAPYTLMPNNDINASSAGGIPSLSKIWTIGDIGHPIQLAYEHNNDTLYVLGSDPDHKIIGCSSATGDESNILCQHFIGNTSSEPTSMLYAPYMKISYLYVGEKHGEIYQYNTASPDYPIELKKADNDDNDNNAIYSLAMVERTLFAIQQNPNLPPQEDYSSVLNVCRLSDTQCNQSNNNLPLMLPNDQTGNWPKAQSVVADPKHDMVYIVANMYDLDQAMNDIGVYAYCADQSGDRCNYDNQVHLLYTYSQNGAYWFITNSNVVYDHKTNSLFVSNQDSGIYQCRITAQGSCHQAAINNGSAVNAITSAAN